MAKILPWYLRVSLPTLGGVCAGLLLMLAARLPTRRAASDYMEAIAIGDGHLPLGQSLARSTSSLFTVASGGSIGREGSMVQLAALSASLIGRVIRLDPARLRLLVACGAAAGITSAYNAPIAGAFFVAEIVLGSIAMESVGPMVVASVVANITMRELAGYKPVYAMPAFPGIFGTEVLLFVGLGVFCGLTAPQFLRLLHFTKKGFGRLPGTLPVRLGLGGLAVGLLSLWVPQTWGNGYSVVNSILHDQWTWSALLTVLIFKLLATAITTGSGAVGGVFTPTLFVGAALGCLFGQVVHWLWPVATSAPFAYAIIGMGAFLAAATNAPLMAILMIFEMTLSYQVVLPLMLSCVFAYFVARASLEASMYEITIHRSQQARNRMHFRALRMRDLIRPASSVLPASACFKDAARIFLEYPVKYIYLVDELQRFSGVVSLHDVTSLLLDDVDTADRCAAEFARHDFPFLTPDMSLEDALHHFLDHQGERLPVVAGGMDRKLLGVVYKSALLDAYFNINNERV